MAEVAWARKYRPVSLDDYLGTTLINTIKNRFSNRDNLPNTIFMYGERGCGKTSGARLLAMEALCLSPVNGRACGECEMCKEIQQYISNSEAGMECVGITEINAADTNGKDSVNEIIEDALVPPVYGERKVLIFDECHRLSKAAQNSLLKLIEEPPSFLIFILCTTDPENVLDTIKSRMQLRIEVKKHSVEALSGRLLEIAKKEKIKTSLEALRIIVKKCDRIPRDSIMMLEDIAKTYGEVTLNSVKKMVGEDSAGLYVEYFEAANKSFEAILKFNRKFKDENTDIGEFFSGLTRFVLDSFYIKSGLNLEEYPEEYVNKIKKLFKLYTSREADTLLQVLEHAMLNLDNNPNKAELLLTTTAIRISKVSRIADGLLVEEVKQGEKENKKAMTEYYKQRELSNQKKKESIHEYEANDDFIASALGGGVSEIEVDTLDTIESTVESKPEEEDNRKVSLEDLERLLNKLNK